ncbi:MAG: hypothetical protein U0790_14290 [Isosphaeraceae bacterium]
MPRRIWIGILTLWPGLAQIWTGQEVLGLMLAALFAATLNLAIVARFLWVESFHAGWADLFGSAALLTWLVSARLHLVVGVALPPGPASAGN